MTKKMLLLFVSVLALCEGGFAQSLFSKAKEDSIKSLEVYKATLIDYFSRWFLLMEAGPVKNDDGEPQIYVNPVDRVLRFTMRVSVNEAEYSEWKDETFQFLARSGISETNDDGIIIGGKTWAFPNKQAISEWIKNVEMPNITFRAMLLDAKGGIVRSADFNKATKREVVETKYEAALRSWTEVKTNTVSTLPLRWLGRMKDYPVWSKTDWLNKKKDGDSCFVSVEFTHLSDEEMERAASVKCVVLDPEDIEKERIEEKKTFWKDQGEEASLVVMSLLADLKRIKAVDVDYALGCHTVSQFQWEAIMDGNPVEQPSKRGADKPVVGAGHEDVTEFIDRVNAHPSLCNLGVRFRIPSVEEWKTAALAGKAGRFATWISRYGATRDMEGGPNEWGFVDILSGCWERVAKSDKEAKALDDGWYACAGGTMKNGEIELLQLPIRYNDFDNPYVGKDSVGLRLCVVWTPQLESAIEKAKQDLATKTAETSPASAIQNIIEEMILVPNTSILFGKYEVTQTQWEAIMGNNPARHQGKQFPVETLSKEQVLEFISKLNSNPVVAKSGMIFRLPTEKEWRMAALAGGMSEDTFGQKLNQKLKQKLDAGEINFVEFDNEYRKLKDGRIENRELKRGFGYGLLADGTEAEPNDVAWHGGDDTHNITTSIDSTAKGMTHKVGLKKPNAFGFYDMCGNVAEIVGMHSFVAIGGCYESKPQHCSVDSTDKYNVWNSPRVGLRLCADWTPALEKVIETGTQKRTSELADGDAAQKPGDADKVGAPGSSGDEKSGVVENEVVDEKPVILDAIDIVSKVIRDKANAEQLIRESRGDNRNDVIIRAEGLDDFYVRGNANVIQEFAIYFQMHSTEIIEKAREKVGLK